MTNFWRYLNFAVFLALRGGGGQHSLVVCWVWCITSFFLNRLADFLSCITDHCNDAIVTTAMIPISVKYLCRSSKCRLYLSHYFKRFMEESQLLPSSQISGRNIQYRCFFQLSVWCKACRSPTLCYFKAIIDFKWQKQGSLSSFRPLTGWGLHRFVWKLQRELLKGIFQPFELGGVTRLIRSAVKFWKASN